MELEKLKNYKDYLDKNYFDLGLQLIPDKEYDVLENIIDNSEQNKKIINAKQGKILLPVQLWSLNKTREYKKNPEKVVIMDKLDGVSCLIYKQKAYTRGNGIYGYDITNMIDKKNFKDIGNNAIRGELVIKKINYCSDFANTRTMVCSFVSKNEFNKNIDFVAYELISLEGYDLSPYNQLLYLHENGFQTVFHTNVIEGNNDVFKEILQKRIKKSDYDIDGIVVSYENIKRKSRELKSNPKYSFAYKQNIKGIPTKVLDIVWNVGKSGLYTPILIIDPVEISGSIIQKVSGYNKDYLLNRKIGKGSKIEVIKAGNVIPCISEVISKSSKINFPNDCDENGVLNKSNDERIEICKFTHFSKVLKIQGIGPSKAKELLENGITPIEIVTKGVEDYFQKLKNSENNKKILLSINQQLQYSTDIDILTALSFFGVGIARSKIIKEELYKNNDAVDLLNKWSQVWKPIKSLETFEPTKDMNKEVICITGSRNKYIENKIKEMGYLPKYNFIKNTKILFVVGKYDDNNKKIQEAIKRGIEIKCI